MGDYDQCYIDDDRLISMRKKNLWGFIDERGNIIVDLIYDDLYSHGEHSATVYKAGNQIEIQRS